MSVQIDRMETSVEITSAAKPADVATPERRTAANAAESRAALREAVASVLSEELDRFLRMRGL